jgi:hypothetical protein
VEITVDPPLRVLGEAKKSLHEAQQLSGVCPGSASSVVSVKML